MKAWALLIISLSVSAVLLTPTVHANNTNLAVIPNFWGGIGSNTTGYVVGNGFNIYPVTENGQTAIEMLRNPATSVWNSADDRELDGQLTSIQPGDTITYTAWLMTTASSERDTNPEHGATIGLDFYGPNGRICEIHTSNGETSYPNYPSTAAVTVMWGTGTWTQVTISFVVQSSYEADPWGAYTAGQQVVPTGFIPWICGYSNSWPGGSPENGTVYATNTQIYINPASGVGGLSSSSVSPPSTSSVSNVVASNITLEPTYTAHGQSFVESGFNLPVNITVRNSGNVSEVAFIALFANSTSICRVALCLNSSASGILNCLVDTSGLPVGNYTISASVIPLGEPNAAPSTITAGIVGITYTGDLHGDFQVNSKDFMTFVADYTACCTRGTYNPSIDFNHDGKIDSKDFFAFVSAYNAYWSS
jgi:hypothetical protein